MAYHDDEERLLKYENCGFVAFELGIFRMRKRLTKFRTKPMISCFFVFCFFFFFFFSS
jgi:hypothetical protein